MICRNTVKWGFASWASGCPQALGVSRVVVLADVHHLPILLENNYINDKTLVFAPSEAPRVDVTFDGDLEAPTSEVRLANSFTIQSTSLALVDFMPTIGPRLLRIATESDLDVLLVAADEAFHNGYFKPILVDPSTIIANETAFGLWRGQGTPNERLWIASDGTVRVSADGTPLGSVRQQFSHIKKSYAELHSPISGCPAALEIVSANKGCQEAIESRPWLKNFLNVAGMWRSLLARGIEPVRASGFGGVHDLESSMQWGRTDYGILWSAENAYIGTGSLGSIIKISRETARVLETVRMLNGDSLNDLDPTIRSHVEKLERKLGVHILPSSSLVRGE
ncbi:daptide biosynthesis RiPP recognition protein [Corynebacterium belfantii]|uniref:daptide biosynthesis RiPP recognition protein n=1 Tax=Corynebacterium belfantii TaxID=2014537 RepID=UPI0018CBBE11|nr:daptide biosynthesis RiPP recognition protein [Corynebacterium belfantii]MBG9288592.1 hypothetical protein [Corynebacterium belfantii]